MLAELERQSPINVTTEFDPQPAKQPRARRQRGAQKPPRKQREEIDASRCAESSSGHEAAGEMDWFLSATANVSGVEGKAKGSARTTTNTGPQAEFSPVGGRPRAISLDDKRLIISMLALGVSIARCARYVGCVRGTIHNEIRRDAEFARGVLLARMQSETDNLARIQRSAERSWRAAAWLIERIDKQEAREAEDFEQLDALLAELGPVPVEADEELAAASEAEVSDEFWEEVEAPAEEVNATPPPAAEEAESQEGSSRKEKTFAERAPVHEPRGESLRFTPGEPERKRGAPAQAAGAEIKAAARRRAPQPQNFHDDARRPLPATEREPVPSARRDLRAHRHD